MRDYVYELEDGVLIIIPKDVADKEYKNQKQRLDKNLEREEFSVRMTEIDLDSAKEIFDDTRNYISKDIKQEAEEKYDKAKVSFDIAKTSLGITKNHLDELQTEYEDLLNSKMPEGFDEFNEVVVLSSSLEEDGFFDTHKDLFEGKDVKVCLNEGIEKYRNTDLYEHYNNDTNEIRREKEFYDEEITYEEQDLARRERNIKDFSDKAKYKSIKIKENLDSENEYTVSELENARKKIDDVASVINSYKNLSPYEKFYLAFSYVQAYEYSKAEGSKPIEDGRALIQILNSKDIVCAGKANMLKAICDQIGIPCIYRNCDCHAINTIAINDPKYGIHGIFNADATNQYRLDFLLFHEDSPMSRELFVDIPWIAELTEKERKYLMEKSGLDKLPKEVLEASKKEFAERDKEILKKFKEIDDNINFNLFNKNKSIKELNDQKMAHYHLMLGMKDIKEGINKDEVVEFSKLSAIYYTIPFSRYNTENHELKNLRELINLGWNIDDFENMKSLSTNEDELREKYKDVYEFFDQKGEEINPETMARAKKELCERIINSCEKSFYFSKEKAVAIDDYLKSFRKKDNLKIDNKIDVGKQIENLADSLVEMQGAHTKDDFDLTRAIIYGSRIDSAKTNNYSGEFEKSQIEYWQECARAYGLDPEKIIPTADVRDFNKVSKTTEGAGMTI